MKTRLEIGDIVQSGVLVSSIKKIENGVATLANNNEVMFEKLIPVEIGKGKDQGIILECKNLRAPIVATGKGVPIRNPKPYLESWIDGEISIISIVESNGFKYVDELQYRLKENAPDFFLRTKI